MGNWVSSPSGCPQETPDDAFWYKNIHVGVLGVAAILEREAYEQMAKPGNHKFANFKSRTLIKATDGGIAIHDSNIDTRKGMTFQTPLSRRTAIYDHTVIRSFIEDHCAKIDRNRAAELTINFRIIHKDPEDGLARLKHAMPVSFEYIKEGFMGEECKRIFCEQLSDQLGICDECHTRPIMYCVIKDEYLMRRHLEKHRNEDTTHEVLRDLLLSTLQ